MSSKTGIGKKGRTNIFLEEGEGGGGGVGVSKKISSANFFFWICTYANTFFFSQKGGSLFAAVNHYLI